MQSPKCFKPIFWTKLMIVVKLFENSQNVYKIISFWILAISLKNWRWNFQNKTKFWFCFCLPNLLYLFSNPFYKSKYALRSKRGRKKFLNQLWSRMNTSTFTPLNQVETWILWLPFWVCQGKRGASKPNNVWLWMNRLKWRRRKLQRSKSCSNSFWLLWMISMCLWFNKGKPQHRTKR